MKDAQVAELFDAFSPSYDERAGDWDAVVNDARRRPLRVPFRVGLAAAVAVAAAVAMLAWPFQAQQGGVLERALAAVGDGPVLHAVMRGEKGGTLVDLSTGERRPVHQETEIWYDTEQARVHTISRLGGVIQNEVTHEPKQPPADLPALAREYRQALESGAARVAGEGVVDGERVTWITIRSELLPDVADGKDHEWAQQVAVSNRTFQPVALRETRDGEPGPGTFQRVLELELLPAGAGDFSTSDRGTLEGRVFRQGREPISLDQARVTLGRAPLWLGREHEGLPLAQAYRETTSSGRREQVEITGPQAKAIRECTERRGAEASACIRALAPTSSLSVRPDGVFRSEGPIVWDEEQVALVLFYGTLGDDASTYREDLVPLLDRPHVTITQSVAPPGFTPGVGWYVPPAGYVFIAAGARRGALDVSGTHVSIEAESEQAILSAARALRAMP